jgi:hypothetical protein
MHLVVDQVVQLQIVHEANRDGALERFTGAAVIEAGLRLGGRELQTGGFVVREGEVEHHADLFFRGTVEHRRGKRNAIAQIARHGHQLVVGKAVEIFLLARAVVHLVQEGADLADLFGLEHFLNAPAETLGSPAEMHFKHLTDVHTRRYAQWVKTDIKRSTVLKEWHILLWEYS